MEIFKEVIHYIFLQWFKRKHKGTKIVSSYFSDLPRGFFSQAGQDSFIYSEFFTVIESGKIPRVFLDIGCNHPTKFSNSYFFEKHLGFKVEAVDPLPTYVAQWATERPNSSLHSVALGAAKGQLQLSVPVRDWGMEDGSHPPDMFATLNTKNPRLTKGNWKTIDVPVLRAQDLFESEGITEVGIVSIDVEGFEIEVLKGIDFSKTKIFIAVIENNTNSKFGAEDIRAHMVQNGFDFYARIWGLDDVFVRSDLKL